MGRRGDVSKERMGEGRQGRVGRRILTGKERNRRKHDEKVTRGEEKEDSGEQMSEK